MNSAERAAILASIPQQPMAVGEHRGPFWSGWETRHIGREVHVRNKLNGIHFTLLRSEAVDLVLTLNEEFKLELPDQTSAPLWWRLWDWLARRTWRKANEEHLRFQVRQMAEKFKNEGGW